MLTRTSIIWIVLITAIFVINGCAKDEQVDVTEMTLSKTTLTLGVGGSETLTATVLPDNATNKTITWSSDKASVATVDANGKVTAVAVGTATLTAACGSKSASCQLTVSSTIVGVTGIILSKTTLTLGVGGSETLTATVLPDNVTNKTITWSSDKASVATVDANGKVTALAKGMAIIFASCGGKVTQCAVTVNIAEAAIGDYFYSDGSFSATFDNAKNCIGIVFRTKTDTQKGLVVSLDERNEIKWATVSYYFDLTDIDDGAINMNKIKGSSFWDALISFKWCSNKGDGWYLPARNELIYLYAAWNGSNSSIPNQETRNAFNAKFGLTPIQASAYWSSNDVTTNGIYVSFANGQYSTLPKGRGLNIRAVFAF